MQATNVIQSFNLFGDSDELPDVVHCETIETRSRLHDWEFEPHRHGRLHQILFLETGGGRASLDGTTMDLPEMAILNIPTGVVHGFQFHRGTLGLVITLSAELLDMALPSVEGLRPVVNRPGLMPAPPEPVATMRMLAEEFSGRGFARAQILRGLASLLLGQIARSLAKEDPAQETHGNPDLMVRFEGLLEQRYAEQWAVSDYAAALSVSTKHLSRVTRSATGRPASALIEERVIREARRNLVYTNLPISTIAYALGYSDPAYFSRVFSRATGHAPRQFRARIFSGSE